MKKLVIANRGEIARRILKAARERHWSVAVISTPTDRNARVRREADACLEVESFLDGTAIVAAAKAWGADFLHPGYGFLSENADFAAAVEAAGIVFVGPTPENMLAMGGKEAAKKLAQDCQVPTLSALLSHELSGLGADDLEKRLLEKGIVSPWLVKASGGGGGRGMRVVETLSELPSAIHRASQEALAAFKDGTVFVERYVLHPRHVEIQVFGDGKGGGVFLGERECSLQRRHQKVIEEAPSARMSPATRQKMGEAALRLVRATHYRGAGTVEFLVDAKGDFFFLEMNTRLQVEHPVTEEVYRVDLVHAQLDLAEGFWPEGLNAPHITPIPTPDGVSLEARILAENPRQGYLPTPGPLVVLQVPQGPGIRFDTGVIEGGDVNSNFDSMIAKLIVWGKTRAEAVDRLSQALERLVILGTPTNVPLLQAMARHPDFYRGEVSTSWMAEHGGALNASLLPKGLDELFLDPRFLTDLSRGLEPLAKDSSPSVWSRLAQKDLGGLRATQGGGGDLSLGWALEKKGPRDFLFKGKALQKILIEQDLSPLAAPSLREAAALARAGREPVLPLVATRLKGGALSFHVAGEVITAPDPRRTADSFAKGTAVAGDVKAPMAGKVIQVLAEVGQHVQEGQVLFVVESMKMQLEVKAAGAARVKEIFVTQGQVLTGPDVLATLET